MATGRKETHIVVDSVLLVMSINSAGDFSRSSTWGDFLKNVSSLTGQNGKLAELVMFLLCSKDGS
jgi:hypothetical protein